MYEQESRGSRDSKQESRVQVSIVLLGGGHMVLPGVLVLKV